MQRPRVRDLGPAMVYVLSLTLLGGTAYQYVSNGSRASRVRAATPQDTSLVPTGGRVLLGGQVIVAGRSGTVEVRVFDAEGRPVAADELHGGSVRFAIVRPDLAQIRPLEASPDGPGCWEVQVPELAVGGYRLITQVQADSTAAPMVLGADLTVAEPQSVAAAAG